MIKKETKDTSREVPSQKVFAPQYRAILLGKIDGYKQRAGGMQDSTLSRRVFGGNEGKFVTNLRDGGNFTMEKAERLERWLAHAEAMLAGAVEPGPLPPAMKQPKPKPEPKAKRKRGRPAVAKPVKANVVDLKSKRAQRKGA